MDAPVLAALYARGSAPVERDTPGFVQHEAGLSARIDIAGPFGAEARAWIRLGDAAAFRGWLLVLAATREAATGDPSVGWVAPDSGAALLATATLGRGAASLADEVVLPVELVARAGPAVHHVRAWEVALPHAPEETARAWTLGPALGVAARLGGVVGVELAADGAVWGFDRGAGHELALSAALSVAP